MMHGGDSRHNMVEQQIRTWDVLDEKVLALYYEVPRADFVAEESLRDLAYADAALPTAGGETMLEPKVEARMLQALALRGTERVLHIGGGSGYFAALLGRLAREVFSVEIDEHLAARAQKRLVNAGANNVRLIHADGGGGLPKFAPYDVVVYTAALPSTSAAAASQLRGGGKLIAIVGAPPIMTLTLCRKIGGDDGALSCEPVLQTITAPLRAPRGESFSF